MTVLDSVPTCCFPTAVSNHNFQTRVSTNVMFFKKNRKRKKKKH